MATPVLANHFKTLKLEDLTVVSPDAGGVGRARAFAQRLDAKLAIIDKRRPARTSPGSSTSSARWPARTSFIYDDMVDTAGTLTLSVEALAKEGAKRIFSACTHPILSGPALERIERSKLERVFATNTIPLADKAPPPDGSRSCRWPSSSARPSGGSMKGAP